MFLSLGRIETAMKSFLREGIPGGYGDDLEPGAVVNGRYRIEQCHEQSKTRSLYTVTRVWEDDKDDSSIVSAGKQTLYRHRCEVDVPTRLFQMEVRQGWLDTALVRRLLTLWDPRVASICDVFSHDRFTYLVSEYMDGVSVDQMEGLLTTRQIRIAGSDLCETVALLHRHGIYGMVLGFSNLRIVDERLRLISLSTSRTGDGLSEDAVFTAEQDDLFNLLDTLEKLAAEYGIMGRRGGLGDLLVSLEDVMTHGPVSPRDIQEALKHGGADPFDSFHSKHISTHTDVLEEPDPCHNGHG